MKYIRTKDDVYEIDEIANYFLDEKQKLFINNTMKIAINEMKVVSQADTIEELCDCLMFVDKQKDFLITEVNRENMNYYDNKKETCYGCIKVELPNGAIRIEPVAEMDNEGCLKLINIKEIKVDERC